MSPKKCLNFSKYTAFFFAKCNCVEIIHKKMSKFTGLAKREIINKNTQSKLLIIMLKLQQYQFKTARNKLLVEGSSPIVPTFRRPNANNIHDNKLEGLAIVIAGGIEYYKMAEYIRVCMEQNTNTEQEGFADNFIPETLTYFYKSLRGRTCQNFMSMNIFFFWLSVMPTATSIRWNYNLS